MWETDKLLVMSNFSFSCSVLKKLVLQTCKNQGLCGKGLTSLLSMSYSASSVDMVDQDPTAQNVQFGLGSPPSSA